MAFSAELLQNPRRITEQILFPRQVAVDLGNPQVEFALALFRPALFVVKGVAFEPHALQHCGAHRFFFAKARKLFAKRIARPQIFRCRARMLGQNPRGRVQRFAVAPCRLRRILPCDKQPGRFQFADFS